MTEITRKVGLFKFSLTTSSFKGVEGARLAAEALASRKEIAHLPQVQQSIRHHELNGHALHDDLVMNSQENGWFSLDVYGLRLDKKTFYGIRWQPTYHATGERYNEQFEIMALAPDKPSVDDIGKVVARRKGLKGILFGK